MTREEHIKKAEELLSGTWRPNVFVGRPPNWEEPTTYAVALAQVHATLALTAPSEAQPEPAQPRRGWWSR